ncbi:ATP-dependent helicase [Paramecium bursaria Chlorella virus NE-JV-1]|nr:ATP-dependent helicase [Paramecium bursaria Chlorella virus NE-JV-1]
MKILLRFHITIIITMLLDSVKLYEYQEKCLKWMLDRERSPEAPGGVLCLDMGLGKTLMTIAVMSTNPLKKTLIIVPTNIVAQWSSEFKKFTGIEPFVIDATSSNKGIVTTDDLDANSIVLAPISVFTAMKNDEDNVLLSYKFDRIVVDEAHIIRNKKTKSYKLISRIISDVKWLLTGTPVVKDEKNFTTLLNFIGIFQVSLSYAAKKYLYRVVKEDVFDLPTLTIQDLRSDFQSDLEKEVYEELLMEGRAVSKAYKAYSDAEGRMEMLKLLLRLRQCTTNINMIPIEDTDYFHEGTSTKLKMLENDIASSPMQKTIVFCHFHKEMTAIENMLKSHGNRVVVLNGKKTADERADAIDSFTNDPTTNFFVIQIDAGGIGLNLQAATRVYINSVHWNGTSEIQAIARSHRIGQTKPVVVKRLIIDDSIDDHIIRVQQNKLSVAADILGDDRIVHSLKSHKKDSVFKSLVENVFK